MGGALNGISMEERYGTATRAIAPQAQPVTGSYKHVERQALEQRLDRSSDNIFGARYDWQRRLPGWF